MSKILQHPIPILILSGGNSPLVRRHLMRLGITAIRQSVAHKLSVLQDELLAFPELDWTDIAYVGDAENDMECLQRVGYPICPSDADEQVQALARYICSRSGGHGAVAEAIDWMLQKG